LAQLQLQDPLDRSPNKKQNDLSKYSLSTMELEWREWI